jgi:hypothetical protein
VLTNPDTEDVEMGFPEVDEGAYQPRHRRNRWWLWWWWWQTFVRNAIIGINNVIMKIKWRGKV